MRRPAKCFRVSLILLPVFFIDTTWALAQCGGTERWAVKVGSDPGASTVDLTNKIPSGVLHLIALPEPNRPAIGDNTTRLAEEIHVYVIRGRLVKFKFETNDNDYHMVITDDTLSFTAGGSAPPSGHSFVAEIPDPSCITGAHGNSPPNSLFIDGIRRARQELEAQFPNIDKSGAFNDAAGIPVGIVGVGFFDFPHKQVGRAPNNIEIHPVLDITFNPPQEGGFTMSASPAQLSIPQGGSATTAITTSVAGGLNAAITLSVAGTPPGASATFNPCAIPAPGSGSSTLSLTTGPSTAAGSYSLKVTGSGGGSTQTASIALTVTSTGTAQIKVVNMIPASLSGETNQDSEPFLAIDKGNPQIMTASAFTPNPWSATGNAPVFVSADGGNTWTLNAILPSQSMTCDITHAFGVAAAHPQGDLYVGILLSGCGQGTVLDELASPDVTSAATMNVQGSRNDVDQPFVQAITLTGSDRVYVGSNDFSQPNGHTATVDVSTNGGTKYISIPIEARNTSGQDGPSVRPTLARDGTVYTAFFGWRNFANSIATADVVVVRDDAGATGPSPFRALVDPSDSLPGRLVATNAVIPFSNVPTLGQERIGSTLSAAVDPNDSATVYVSWADRVGNGDIYTIHLRRSTDRGLTWSGDLRTITNATNAALAVADNGTVGFLYQQLDASGHWVTHLEQTRNVFANVQDTILAKVPGDTPPAQFLPYLGDYEFLLAVGNEFRGIFSANNTPDLANFPQGVKYQRSADFTAKTLSDGSGNPVAISIDPFYFSVPVMP